MFNCTRLSLNLVLVSLLLGCLAGCSRRTHQETIRLDIPDTFSIAGTGSAPDKWWQAFEDSSLNGLVEQALNENLDVLVAWDRLAQAEAVAIRAESTAWPGVDLSGGISRTRREVSNMSFYNTDNSLALGAGYEVDLWSRLKSSRQAARLDADAQRQAVYTVAITISASVAETWYQLAEAKALEKVALQQIETNQKVLKIVTMQFRKGMSSAADVLRQRQLVAATQAQNISVEEAIQLLQNRLSILIGTAPTTAWQDRDIDFPTLPELPDAGVPADVLWRRPDVRGAFQKVQAADHRLAVAITDQYPRLSLSGSIGTSAPSIHDLFDDWMANLIANAFQPLFDAGSRKAEVKRQEAAVSESLHRWEQSILNALAEVEDTLVQEQQQRKAFENLTYQLKLARQTFERNRQRYIKGQSDYIRVLESLQSLQSLERNVITSHRAVIQRRIALYRSIAGKWDMPKPEIEQLSSTDKSSACDISSSQYPKESL